ncbi:PfkB family carbohydrate kinase [Streptomyces capparidis]
MSGPGLLVVGDVVTDIVAVQERPLAHATDTPARIGIRPGGSGANTAAWAAHLGASVRLLARVGAEYADWHRRELARHGVRPELRVDPVRPTARVIVLVDPEGERTMVTDRAAGGRLGPEDWDDALLDGVGLLHLSGYTLFTECGRRLAGAALAAAERAAVPVTVDPASAGFLTAFGPRRFLRETRGCAAVLPNEDEAALLAPAAPDPEAAALALSRDYGLAVVKRGRDGAVAARDGRIVARGACDGVRPLDLTGAGDAFAGGFLAARLAGADVPAALDAACRAGARAVTLPGGRPERAASGRTTARTPTAPAGSADPPPSCTGSPEG